MFKKFINNLRHIFKLFEYKLIFLALFNYTTICFAIFAKDYNRPIYTILLCISLATATNLFINLGKTIDRHNEFIDNYYELVKELDSNNQTNTNTITCQKLNNLIDLHDYIDSDDKCHGIVCDNYKDALECCKLLDSQGYKWSSGNSYLDSNCYSIDYKYICYLFNKGVFIRCRNLSELNTSLIDLHYWIDLHSDIKDDI